MVCLVFFNVQLGPSSRKLLRYCHHPDIHLSRQPLVENGWGHALNSVQSLRRDHVCVSDIKVPSNYASGVCGPHLLFLCLQRSRLVVVVIGT